MASVLYLSPLTFIVQYFTNLGIIAAGASITTQVAGSVSILQTTYTDSSGLVANPNPLTLNSAGRAAGSGGQLVAFWQPAGVSIDAYFTDVQGDTWSIKNIPGLNDPSGTAALQTLLASPASSNVAGAGPVAGADLVANAVKSYDVFADLRAANTPTLVSGQTLIVMVEGALSIGDGLGGIFWWNSTSAAADDGATVIKPTTTIGNGRYLRLVLPANNSIANTGSFTGTTTDVTGGVSSGIITYSQIGNVVSLKTQAVFNGTSTSTTFTITGLPTAITPATNTVLGIGQGAADNGSGCGYYAIVLSTGALQFFKLTSFTAAATGWTNSGNKTLPSFSFTYSLP